MAIEFGSRKETFDNFKVYETMLAGRPFKVEMGKMCGLSNASALIRYGETCVMCNVVMSPKPREGVDFFPLNVEYEEKLYAAGRIPGSFMRREGRPGERAILTSRVVDRPMRPLFPKEMRNDVCITMTVMSLDPDCSPEIAGMIGASLVTAVSEIPWNGPIGGVQVGLVDGEIVLNPTKEQREHSDLSLTLAASEEKIAAAVAMLREKNPTATIVTTDWNELTGAQIVSVMDGKRDLVAELLSEAQASNAAHADEDEEEHHHHHHDHDEDGHECCHHHHDHDDDDDDEDEHEHHHHDGECCCGHHHHHHDHDADEVFTSWGHETAHKYSHDELESILTTLDSGEYGAVLRAKGIVDGGDTWYEFDMVPGEHEIRTCGPDVTGKVCVIGSQLKEHEVEELFHA